MSPLPSITTPRLLLRASDVSLASAVAEHLARNRVAHARWNPPMPEGAFTAEGQRERLALQARAEAEGREIAWWLSLHDEPARVIGHLRLSQIARGPFCNAMLGYAIDIAHEGRGLMREALQATLADAFGPRVRLHRVQANVRPENVRSLRLLEVSGFAIEGRAKEYLFIDGAWRDHLLTARRAPDWPETQAP